MTTVVDVEPHFVCVRRNVKFANNLFYIEFILFIVNFSLLYLLENGNKNIDT